MLSGSGDGGDGRGEVRQSDTDDGVEVGGWRGHRDES
jgi:hypothetical protein